MFLVFLKTSNAIRGWIIGGYFWLFVIVFVFVLWPTGEAVVAISGWLPGVCILATHGRSLLSHYITDTYTDICISIWDCIFICIRLKPHTGIMVRFRISAEPSSQPRVVLQMIIGVWSLLERQTRTGKAAGVEWVGVLGTVSGTNCWMTGFGLRHI